MIPTAVLRTVGIVLAAAGVALVAFSSGATAQPTDGSQVGICVVCVDSPCNGEEWDGDAFEGNLDPPSGDPLPGDGYLPSESSAGPLA